MDDELQPILDAVRNLDDTIVNARYTIAGGPSSERSTRLSVALETLGVLREYIEKS